MISHYFSGSSKQKIAATGTAFLTNIKVPLELSQSNNNAGTDTSCRDNIHNLAGTGGKNLMTGILLSLSRNLNGWMMGGWW